MFLCRFENLWLLTPQDVCVSLPVLLPSERNWSWALVASGGFSQGQGNCVVSECLLRAKSPTSSFQLRSRIDHFWLSENLPNVTGAQIQLCSEGLGSPKSVDLNSHYIHGGSGNKPLWIMRVYCITAPISRTTDYDYDDSEPLSMARVWPSTLCK